MYKTFEILRSKYIIQGASHAFHFVIVEIFQFGDDYLKRVVYSNGTPGFG